jgi:hypothetical protein
LSAAAVMTFIRAERIMKRQKAGRASRVDARRMREKSMRALHWSAT